MTDQEFLDWIRFWLGGIDESVISDENLQMILDMVQMQYPDASDCRIKYEFAKSLLEWLIRKEASGTGSEIGTGAVKRRTEKVGKREVTQEWDVGSTSNDTVGWQGVLDDLVADPDSVGCTVFPVEDGSTSTGAVIIGGKGIPVYGFGTPTRRHLNKWLDDY